ncbi:MAG: hypothetical protein ACR2P5_06980 [Gammaproteobacteria bacterium]
MSFLRKQESISFGKAETFAAGEKGAASPLFWIPAFAGMTWGERWNEMGERLSGWRFTPISLQTAKGGGTPPVCIPTLERRDELKQ